MRVKVCGITRVEDARLAADLGAAAVGFVFWPGSPRCIDPYRARTISLALPPFLTAVGVFVDQDLEYVKGVAKLVRLGALQLHGSETAAYAREVGHRVIKSMAVGPDFDLGDLDRFSSSVTILLDVHDPVRRGGTGRTIDWKIAAEVAARRPAILSGGLNAGNVEEAIRAVKPYAIDVSSGVEEAPGVKDGGRMREFFEAIRLMEGAGGHASGGRPSAGAGLQVGPRAL